MRSTDEVGKAVAANVKRLRAERGLTLEQVVAALAERGVFLVPSTVHRLENGARHVRLEEAPQVAAVFGVTVADLLSPPQAGVPEEVEQLVAEVLEHAERADVLQAEAAEAEFAAATARDHASAAAEFTADAAKQLRKALRTRPEVAAAVATALAGRVPRTVAVEALPEDYWPEVPEAAEDDSVNAKALREAVTNVVRNNKGRKK
jgi:transcriptional regulator with XRE-family HTH domain